MTEPFAYLNGQFLPAGQAMLPVTDAGFMQGVTVAEQVRTFGGKLFRLDRHIKRLFRSLEIVGVEAPLSSTEMVAAAEELVGRNHALLDEGDDLGLSIFVTPGIYPTFAPDSSAGATLGMHTYPLPFSMCADLYTKGQALVTTEVQQVPAACWSAELKCRSRMHYYLADLQARQIEPGARALLLDADGLVTEASTANVVVYHDGKGREGEGLVSPPQENILPGISLAVLIQLAEQLAIPFSHRELTPDDIATANEVILSSTSCCLFPATRFNGNAVGTGQPGPIFGKLLAAWSELVGLEIAAQAERFSRR